MNKIIVARIIIVIGLIVILATFFSPKLPIFNKLSLSVSVLSLIVVHNTLMNSED